MNYESFKRATGDTYCLVIGNSHLQSRFCRGVKEFLCRILHKDILTWDLWVIGPWREFFGGRTSQVA